jgi:hypothetical protein
MQNLTQTIFNTARKRAKCILSDRVQPQHKPTELCDLSDELIGCILRNLTFSEKAEAHLVCPRFQNVLAKPDPSLRIYGSLSIDLGVELTNKNSAWELTRLPRQPVTQTCANPEAPCLLCISCISLTLSHMLSRTGTYFKGQPAL